MKHLFTLAILLFFVFSCSHNPTSLSESKTSTFSKIPKQDRIDLAMEHEFQLTRDPATNTVPRNRLLAANEYRKRMLAEQINNNAERSAISGIDWEERGPDNVAGRTRAILFDVTDATNNTVFSGGVAGGIWKTTNFLSGSPNWAPVDEFMDNLAVTAIAQDPTNTSHIYVGTGEGWFNGDATQGLGIFRSTDGGSTFSQFKGTDNPHFKYIQDLLFDTAGNLYASTRDAGVQKFPSGGSSWTQVLGSGVGEGATNRAADLELGADGSIYASLGIFSTGSVWKSDISNGASTGDDNNWTDITPGAGRRMEIAVSPTLATAGYIYVLIHSSVTSDCSAIYQSTNGGTSWTARTVPPILGGSNFTRGQAWYDLIAVVDPNNENTVYIGGVDLHRTTDGGANWDQMSNWYSLLGYPYVHADQHVLHYLTGSSSQLVVGNDGGIFYTSNADITGALAKPTFVSKNQDYNITQYYACAIHPTSGTDYFLAGAQDNGSQQYTTAGINSTNEVTGGDGAFCHIDQDNANVQITSYVYNAYRISTNSFSSYSSYTIGSSAGKFINPTDYDDAANILYGSYNSGFYSYITGVGSSNTTGNRSIGAFGSQEPSAVTVSPNTSNRVFFGLDNGDVVRVDDAHNGSASGTLIFDASVITGISLYAACVAVEDGDDNHLLVTFSNFGVISIWESLDGGGSWTSVEGNLPDMPVRWAMFAPEDGDQALIGTDLGVWTTNNLDGNSTVWGPSNTGLGNIRVDMLQHRSSDNTIIAATHGRGLFSTDAFSDPNINIQETASVVESSADGFKSAPDDCIGYKDYTINVQIARSPSTDANVSISVNGSSTATDTEDFDLITTSLVFTSGGSLIMPVTVRVYNDGFEELDETILLDITLTNGGSTNAQLGSADQATLTIPGNDAAPLSADSFSTLGSGSAVLNMPFRGSYSDARTQIFYSASDLLDQGLSAGAITGLALDVSTKSSSQPYQNFTIRIKKAGLSDLDVLEEGGTTVYSQDYTTALGWNEFIFDNSFFWDGESNLLVEFCFDNGSATAADDVNCTVSSYISVWYRRDNGTTGCDLSLVQFTSSNRPNLRFYNGKKSDVATEITSAESYVGANETVNFYDATGNVICTIVNGAHDFGCTVAEIDRSVTSAGKDTVAFWEGNDDAKTMLAKTVKLTPTNPNATASYSLTTYLSAAEVNNWETKSGNVLNNIQMVKTANPIETTTPANPLAGGASEAAAPTTTAFGTDHALTASFTTGMSGFGFGIPGPSPGTFPVEWLSFDGIYEDGKVILDWETASESNNKGFEIERSVDGINFDNIGFVSGWGTATSTQAYAFEDPKLNFSVRKYFYRLKQVDFDGEFEYSQTINITLPNDPFKFSVAPNPFIDRFEITLPLEVNAPIVVQLYTSEGKLVQSIFEGKWNGTPIVVDQAIQSIPSGIYLLKGNSVGKIYVKKLVKLK